MDKISYCIREQSGIRFLLCKNEIVFVIYLPLLRCAILRCVVMRCAVVGSTLFRFLWCFFVSIG